MPGYERKAAQPRKMKVVRKKSKDPDFDGVANANAEADRNEGFHIKPQKLP
jgi:hypothetical protein